MYNGIISNAPLYSIPILNSFKFFPGTCTIYRSRWTDGTSCVCGSPLVLYMIGLSYGLSINNINWYNGLECNANCLPTGIWFISVVGVLPDVNDVVILGNHMMILIHMVCINNKCVSKNECFYNK